MFVNVVKATDKLALEYGWDTDRKQNCLELLNDVSMDYPDGFMDTPIDVSVHASERDSIVLRRLDKYGRCVQFFCLTKKELAELAKNLT